MRRSTLQKLASLEIRPEELELRKSVDELVGFFQEASPEQLQSWTEDMKAFREKVGGYPLKDDGQAALAGEPIERHKAAALGYYSLALIEVYKLRKLLEAKE